MEKNFGYIIHIIVTAHEGDGCELINTADGSIIVSSIIAEIHLRGTRLHGTISEVQNHIIAHDHIYHFCLLNQEIR